MRNKSKLLHSALEFALAIAIGFVITQTPIFDLITMFSPPLEQFSTAGRL